MINKVYFSNKNEQIIENVDILILGGGMVGLSLAYQLANTNRDFKIKILDKEKELGLHNSGRNSGVLHAGIYYKPGSLRAKVCVDGAKRLKEWCLTQGLEVLQCGKVIVTQRPDQKKELDLLMKRATQNGAKVEFIERNDLKQYSNEIFCATEKALWSPNTCVVDPKAVIKRLRKKVDDQGVELELGVKFSEINPEKRILKYQTNGIEKNISYGHFFNCAGIHTDEVAKKFNICENYKIFPFKGIYWKLKPNAPFEFRTNVYPVPDLNVPFLGVHVTPNVNGEVFLGPTAIPAFGKENYNSLDNLEPFLTANFFANLGLQWIKNQNGFRRYAREQALQGLKPFFMESAKNLIPSLKDEHLIKSTKAGIRAQLFDIEKKELIQDFKLVNSENSTHILNAISPAFTASFALADLIIERSQIFYKS